LSDWETAFSYEPAGFVSGHYVDLIPSGADEFHFALRDVSGKGVGASLLMSHLHATLRALLLSKQSIEEVLGIASRRFCESVLSSQFATLVLGKADHLGNFILVNAGHTPVLVIENGEVRGIPGTSLPLDLFFATRFNAQSFSLRPGSTLLLYSDGISESTNDVVADFDLTGMVAVFAPTHNICLPYLLKQIQHSIVDFAHGAEPSDDRTMLALR
jgi:sigma-B regulation protein RsbU (phosphoserine phosphatase)